MTDKYAVFGNPIGHSKSPQIHAAFARQTQQDLVYEKHLIDEAMFVSSVKDFFYSEGKGLNITVPFKQEAYSLADKLTERAKLAGAVNTLYLDNESALVGDNTDGVGLVNDISKRLNWQIENKNILVLGAGGAVRGILYPLLQALPNNVVIANRTHTKAEGLANSFSEYGPVVASHFAQASSLADNEGYDIIINGTAASLSQDIPAISGTCVSPETKVYDMAYSDDDTVFMSWAHEQGALECVDGIGMLVGQAAESFTIWRGVRPETMPVIRQLRSR